MTRNDNEAKWKFIRFACVLLMLFYELSSHVWHIHSKSEALC